MREYLAVLILLIIATGLAGVIILAAYVLGIKKPDQEKVSIYECGFDPLGDTRQQFEVRFFLVAILFIIFDLEISFLFPWAVVLSELTTNSYWISILFFGILGLGLYYEWMKGGLEWE